MFLSACCISLSASPLPAAPLESDCFPAPAELTFAPYTAGLVSRCCHAPLLRPLQPPATAAAPADPSVPAWRAATIAAAAAAANAANASTASNAGDAPKAPISVLPLPSPYWSEGADMWFCHNKRRARVSAARHDVQPRPGRLYVGLDWLLAHETDLAVPQSALNAALQVTAAVTSRSHGTSSSSRTAANAADTASDQGGMTEFNSGGSNSNNISSCGADEGDRVAVRAHCGGYLPLVHNGGAASAIMSAVAAPPLRTLEQTANSSDASIADGVVLAKAAAATVSAVAGAATAAAAVVPLLDSPDALVEALKQLDIGTTAVDEPTVNEACCGGHQGHSHDDKDKRADKDGRKHDNDCGHGSGDCEHNSGDCGHAPDDCGHDCNEHPAGDREHGGIPTGSVDPLSVPGYLHRWYEPLHCPGCGTLVGEREAVAVAVVVETSTVTTGAAEASAVAIQCGEGIAQSESALDTAVKRLPGYVAHNHSSSHEDCAIRAHSHCDHTATAGSVVHTTDDATTMTAHKATPTVVVLPTGAVRLFKYTLEPASSVDNRWRGDAGVFAPYRFESAVAAALVAAASARGALRCLLVGTPDTSSTVGHRSDSSLNGGASSLSRGAVADLDKGCVLALQVLGWDGSVAVS